VASLGGTLAVDGYGDSVSVSALVPASGARAVARAMTTAYFAPVLTPEGFRKATAEVAQDALVRSFDAEAVVRDAVFGALFVSGPQRSPALGDPAALAAVSAELVRSFAGRAFRAQNAVFVASGTVDGAIVSAIADGRPATGEARKAEAPADPSATRAPAATVREFPESGGGLGWVGPSIGDERAATALDFLADYLFRPGTGVMAQLPELRAAGTFLSGQFVTLHDPGVFFVSWSGDGSAAIGTAVAARIAAAARPLDPAAFAAARNGFVGHILGDLQTPTEQADNFGWYSVEGNFAYAPGANGGAGPYLRAVESLTPEFVASVARKYLGAAPARVTLTPPASRKGISS